MCKEKATINRKQKWKEKQLNVYFKRQINETAHERIWKWLEKGNLKRETEYLLITTHNNTLKTNYVKVKIYNLQYNNRKCWLCGEKDETINHMISECNIQYKSTYGWEGELIPWGLCRRLKFDHSTKWYMHKLESVSENFVLFALIFGYWRMHNFAYSFNTIEFSIKY